MARLPDPPIGYDMTYMNELIRALENALDNSGVDAKAFLAASLLTEDDWTPTGNGITFAAASGHYVRLGDMVTAYFDVTWPTTADAGLASIQSLPFTCSSTHPGGGIIGFSTEATAMVLGVSASADEAILRAPGDALGTGMTNAELSTERVFGVLQYLTE